MSTLGQQDIIKLNKNAITMSFMFNMYIRMCKNKHNISVYPLTIFNVKCSEKEDTRRYLEKGHLNHFSQFWLLFTNHAFSHHDIS